MLPLTEPTLSAALRTVPSHPRDRESPPFKHKITQDGCFCAYFDETLPPPVWIFKGFVAWKTVWWPRKPCAVTVLRSTPAEDCTYMHHSVDHRHSLCARPSFKGIRRTDSISSHRSERVTGSENRPAEVVNEIHRFGLRAGHIGRLS